MRNPKMFLFMILLFVVVGCKPDLAVENVSWDGPTKTATASVKNIGKGDAGNFMVYFNGDENPVSQDYRPQVSHSVPGLTKGQSITLTAPFGPLARPENHNLRNVYQITVIADPKDMVKESNEGNNSKSIPVQIF
jgi:subtilase family serine protease